MARRLEKLPFLQHGYNTTLPSLHYKYKSMYYKKKPLPLQYYKGDVDELQGVFEGHCSICRDAGCAKCASELD